MLTVFLRFLYPDCQRFHICCHYGTRPNHGFGGPNSIVVVCVGALHLQLFQNRTSESLQVSFALLRFWAFRHQSRLEGFRGSSFSYALGARVPVNTDRGSSSGSVASALGLRLSKHTCTHAHTHAKTWGGAIRQRRMMYATTCSDGMLQCTYHHV